MKTTQTTVSRDVGGGGQGPCVSVYIPYDRQRATPGGDSASFSRLLERAKQQLERWGSEADLIHELLEPLHALNARLEFSTNHTEGLVVFRKPGFLRHHPVLFPVPEVCVVADRFHLAPLFHGSTANRRFYLLAISLTGAKLFEAISDRVTVLQGVEFPASPITPGRQLEGQRNNSPGARFFAPHRRHPQERRSLALVSWFQRVDGILRQQLECERAPVVLVGVEYLSRMFRHVSCYPNLLEGEIHGGSETFSPEDLWRRGSEIASGHFDAERRRIADEYLSLWHTTRATNDLRDIEVAARQGRIQTLIIGVREPPRCFDAVCCGEGPSVLDVATLNTFMTGGVVYALPPDEVPGRAEAAAVLRY